MHRLERAPPFDDLIWSIHAALIAMLCLLYEIWGVAT